MNNSFWRGIIAALCMNQMIQDLLGKERFISLVELYWVDQTIWYGWFIIVVICIIIQLKSEKNSNH